MDDKGELILLTKITSIEIRFGRTITYFEAYVINKRNQITTNMEEQELGPSTYSFSPSPGLSEEQNEHVCLQGLGRNYGYMRRYKVNTNKIRTD